MNCSENILAATKTALRDCGKSLSPEHIFHFRDLAIALYSEVNDYNAGPMNLFDLVDAVVKTVFAPKQISLGKMLKIKAGIANILKKRKEQTNNI